MEQFKDAHYFHMPSQGSMYTITELKLANGSTKLLVASLKREIFCFEYLESPTGSLVPTTKEVSFTYIPSGAEIISIDAFNKSPTKNEFVIGITIIKNSNDSDTLETFLNIYSEWDESEDFHIENIAQNCLNVELNYIPYKLLHTFLVTWKDDIITNKEVVFILSGSDNQVHVYQENTKDHVYKEIDSNRALFPEFSKTPSPVIWIDIFYTDDYSERITAFGCECGYVKLLKVNTKTSKLVYNFSTKFGNYIANVHLYPENNSKLPCSHAPIKNLSLKQNSKSARLVLNLVVVNTILPGVLFHDVLKYGLSNYTTLPRHDNTIVLTCCVVADIDFDGEYELLVGNSAEEIMMYKKDKKKGWCLEELKSLSAPVMNLKYTDITGDGAKELVVMSLKGIHVLQHDHCFVSKVENQISKMMTLLA